MIEYTETKKVAHSTANRSTAFSLVETITYEFVPKDLSEYDPNLSGESIFALDAIAEMSDKTKE